MDCIKKILNFASWSTNLLWFIPPKYYHLISVFQEKKKSATCDGRGKLHLEILGGKIKWNPWAEGALLAPFPVLSKERLWSHSSHCLVKESTFWHCWGHVLQHHEVHPKSHSSWFSICYLQMWGILEENLRAIHHAFLREQINFPGIPLTQMRCAFFSCKS